MKKRIYYHDTDAGGVVYYGNYLKFLEEARTEYLENKGLSVLELQKQGFLYAVRHCSVTYKNPARYGDTLICGAHLKKITAAQMFFDQTIVDEKTQNLVIKAQVTLVSLNQQFKPTPIPEDIKLQLL